MLRPGGLGFEILTAPVVDLTMIDSVLNRNRSDGIRLDDHLAGDIQIAETHSKRDYRVRESGCFRADYGLPENRRDLVDDHGYVSFAEVALVLAVAEAAVGKRIRSFWLSLSRHTEWCCSSPRFFSPS